MDRNSGGNLSTSAVFGKRVACVSLNIWEEKGNPAPVIPDPPSAGLAKNPVDKLFFSSSKHAPWEGKYLFWPHPNVINGRHYAFCIAVAQVQNIIVLRNLVREEINVISLAFTICSPTISVCARGV